MAKNEELLAGILEAAGLDQEGGPNDDDDDIANKPEPHSN